MVSNIYDLQSSYCNIRVGGFICIIFSIKEIRIKRNIMKVKIYCEIVFMEFFMIIVDYIGLCYFIYLMYVICNGD